MPATEPKSDSEFACASESQRTLKDLRLRRRGQPVYILGHTDNLRGQEAVFEHFNVRLAVVKFPNGKLAGYDPLELLLPCEIHEDGTAYFEIRQCQKCDQIFPLTSHEFLAEQERAECPECAP